MAQILNLTQFDGGLRTDVHQSLIGDNESPDCGNVWEYLTGTLTKRRGIREITTISTGVSSKGNKIFCYNKPGTTMDYRIYILQLSEILSTLKLYESVTPSNRYDDISSFTEYTTTSLDPHQGSTLTPYNNALLLNGVLDVTSALAQFDGSSIAGLTGFPGARSARTAVYKDHVFSTAGSGAGDFTLRWSKFTDFTEWPDTFTVEVGLRDGMPILSFLPFNDDLIIFKSPRFLTNTAATAAQGYEGSTIWKLTGDQAGLSNGVYSLQQIYTPTNFGLSFPDAYFNYFGSLVFLTNQGLIAFDGSSFQNLTEKIRPTVTRWSKYQLTAATDDLNNLSSDIVQYKDVLFTTIAETPTKDMNTVYALHQGRIWRHTNSLGIMGMTIDYNDKLLATGQLNASTQTIKLYQLEADTYVDGTTGIDAYYKTKEFDFKQNTHFEYAYVDYRRQPSGILKFRYNVDQKGWVERQIDMSGTYGSIKRSQRLLIGDHGRTIQFELANSEPHVNFEIFSVQVHGNAKGLDNTGGSPSI